MSDNPSTYPTGRRAAVTIGNFDGVHRGHRAIVEATIADARRQGLLAVALTFEPHPVTVFRGQPADAFRLSTSAERTDALRALGIDEVVTLPFEPALHSLTAAEFFHTILIERLGAQSIHVGHDFAFGRGRAGDITVLNRLASEAGIQIQPHQAVEHGGRPVSSSRVRDAIRAGNLAEANTLLAAPLSFSATPEPGHQRGRELGVPTLNLYPRDRLLPPHGVYVSRVLANSGAYPAISNLGVRPTFGDDVRISLESHLLPTAPADLDSTRIRVQLCAFLRTERRFPSVHALQAQIAADVVVARRWHQGDHPVPD